MNHLEKLDLIDKNSLICDIYYKKFIQKSYESDSIYDETDTDIYIRDCLSESQ